MELCNYEAEVREQFPNATWAIRKLRGEWFTLWIQCDGERLSVEFDYQGGFKRAEAEQRAWEYTARTLPLRIPAAVA